MSKIEDDCQNFENILKTTPRENYKENQVISDIN